MKGMVIVMGLFLFICFVVMEVVLMVSSFTKYTEKKQWLLVRWVLRAGELAVFLFVMLLPNVTFDFKYQLCFYVLMLRLARALIMYLVRRNSVTGKRSKAGAVLGGIGSIIHGKLITVDPAFLQEVIYINEDGTSEEEIFHLSQEWINLRVVDIDYVVDCVETAKKSGCENHTWFVKEKADIEAIENILAMTDIEKIGLMGHSLGGAASVTVGRIREDIDAVIDLDGTMLGEQKSYENGEYQYIEEPYPVPIFSLDNEEHYWGGKESGVLYVNSYVTQTSQY